MRRKGRLVIPVIITLLLLGATAWGAWLWYDANIDRSGWVIQDNVRFYRDFHAQPVSGWLDIGGSRYCFHEDGTPRTGWQDIDGETYYFSEEGSMLTDWQQIQGERYYFSQDGVMEDGWLVLDAGVYYLREGAMTTRWQSIDGDTYYFTEEGLMVTGFQEIDGSTYYFDEEGVMLTGEQILEERIYFFEEDGAMHTGWDEGEDGRRYFYEDGPMARGWTTVEDRLYYFHDSGIAATGWVTMGEYTYYFFPEDGHAAVGPTEIEGQLHYFSPKGVEIVLVNAKNPVPDYYERNLKNVTGYHDVDERCYDALIQMLADCEEAGIKYNLNSAYRSIAEQTQILELRTAEHMEAYDLTFENARKKALQTVALPGTSEHHLGLAVDLLGQEAVEWFQEHCWDYGFIVRYRADQYEYTGIIDEPWHFRYVGVEVARDIRESGMSLEEYLGAEPVKPGETEAETFE